MNKFQTICKIPLEDGARCGHVIVQSKEPMQLPEIGQPTPDRSKQFVQAIVGHIVKKHPAFGSILMNTWEQFLGFQAINFIESDDGEVLNFMQRYAAYVASATVVPVSDEAIESHVENMAFEIDDPRRAEVIQAMKAVRDTVSRKKGTVGNPG